ncbi:MAG TPA: SIS domain-containing protein [Mycobacteriales bacterium]|nr:SIS domain-containing protein [Mycobacteriales bacterium]
MSGPDLVRRRLTEAADVTSAMLAGGLGEQTADAASRIVAALRAGGKVIFFGNGGSSMDAGHLAAELLGRFYRDRPALPALSLPDATAAMTAIGNDYSYADVFARQLRGLGRAGDVAVGLTTSGNSENVVRALTAARELGMLAIALTGAGGGRVRAAADICLEVPTSDTPRVQEACMHLGHSICEIVEAELF